MKERLPLLRSFGELVRQRRKELGLNQTKLAELASLDFRTIQRIEAGDQNLTVRSILQVARVFNH